MNIGSLSEYPVELTTAESVRIGVISDTHGLLRPEAADALAGSDLIIHAGDIGSTAVLRGLMSIAPVIAVRGNMDHGDWACSLHGTELVDVGGCLVYVLHDLQRLDLDPAAAGFCVVVSGHSHQPLISSRKGVLYLNPGSAGPKRFELPVSVALMQIENGRPESRLLTLLK